MSNASTYPSEELEKEEWPSSGSFELPFDFATTSPEIVADYIYKEQRRRLGLPVSEGEECSPSPEPTAGRFNGSNGEGGVGETSKSNGATEEDKSVPANVDNNDDDREYLYSFIDEEPDTSGHDLDTLLDSHCGQVAQERQPASQDHIDPSSDSADNENRYGFPEIDYSAEDEDRWARYDAVMDEFPLTSDDDIVPARRGILEVENDADDPVEEGAVDYYQADDPTVEETCSAPTSIEDTDQGADSEGEDEIVEFDSPPTEECGDDDPDSDDEEVVDVEPEPDDEPPEKYQVIGVPQDDGEVVYKIAYIPEYERRVTTPVDKRAQWKERLAVAVQNDAWWLPGCSMARVLGREVSHGGGDEVDGAHAELLYSGVESENEADEEFTELLRKMQRRREMEEKSEEQGKRLKESIMRTGRTQVEEVYDDSEYDSDEDEDGPWGVYPNPPLDGGEPCTKPEAAPEKAWSFFSAEKLQAQAKRAEEAAAKEREAEEFLKAFTSALDEPTDDEDGEGATDATKEETSVHPVPTPPSSESGSDDEETRTKTAVAKSKKRSALEAFQVVGSPAEADDSDSEDDDVLMYRRRAKIARGIQGARAVSEQPMGTAPWTTSASSATDKSDKDIGSGYATETTTKDVSSMPANREAETENISPSASSSPAVIQTPPRPTKALPTPRRPTKLTRAMSLDANKFGS
ncbi:hypothetical protein ONZ45_g6942 [Pleurotus djamor]|nr:hypothetical protein ONZ45_g6942 [Pleurotus djamor]